MVFRGQEIENRIESLLEPLLKAQGYEVVAVEFIHSHHGKVLRVTIDKPKGISLKDCEKVHRQINPLLERATLDLKYQDYQIEVSSPGVDRILKKREDFERFSGQTVNIQLFKPLNEVTNQRNFSGLLKGIKNGRICLEVGSSVIEIPWEQIKVAHIKYLFK